MPLRDLLVTGILLYSLPHVFRHAFIGVLLWTWIGVMNPHKLGWGFIQDAPVAAFAAVITIIALFTTRDRVKMSGGPVVLLLAAFILWTCITTAFAFMPGESWPQLVRVLKIQLMTFIAIAVLYTREHIRLFIWVNVLSLGFYGLKGGIYTLLKGGAGRVWGPPGGFIEGNNELALALIMAIPLMNYLRMTTPYPWVRRGLLAMMLLSAVSALGTQSRGALIAIFAMGVLLWWRGPNKVVVGALGALLVAGVLAFMPESWHLRMDTITEYEQDSSAMGRINAWWTMYNLANDQPLGGGFEVYNPLVFGLYAPDPSVPRAAHSIYFQVLGEHGWIGLALFLALWLATWHTAGVVRRRARQHEESRWLRNLAGMCQVSLVGYAVGGAFLSLAYFDLPYNILLTIVVARRWLQERGWEAEPEPAPIPPPAPAPASARVLGWLRTA